MSEFVTIDRATLEQLVVAQPCQGLSAYLRCEAGDTFVGSPNHETLMQWAREVDALTAGRAALANAEPKPKMLSDILKDTL